MATKGKKRVPLPPHAALDPNKQKEFNQKTQEAKKKAADGPAEPGVIYISHLPWGFVEQPLRKFFKQFGKIQKLRISRSKKTGNSKGYAYIQFANAEVAKIAADTMNNYLMFNKLLKCKYLPDPHPDTFKNADRPFYQPRGPRKAIELVNKPKTEAALNKSRTKSLRKLSKTKKKLADLGIDYSVEVMGTTDPSVAVKEEPDSDREEPTGKSVTKKAAGDRKSGKGQAKAMVNSGKTKRKDSLASDADVEVKIEIDCDGGNDKEETVQISEKQPKRKLRMLPSKQKPKKQKR